jgi:O-acetylhomoserine/O-acetylserine sulfhydrylase-like pyridoxal-dependent enzyme
MISISIPSPVRAGIQRSQFGEHSEALYLTSSFVFQNAAQAAARFSGAEPGMVYARFTNPTISALQERLAALEGAEMCVATASGMSAILAMIMALLSAGDHIVSSQSIFGSSQQLFGNILSRFGIETTYVPATDVDAYRAALRSNTKLIFVETPSNPLMEVVDIAAVAEVAHSGGALLAVDNCFLHTCAAAAFGAGSGPGHSFGDKVSGRAGPCTWRRSLRAERASGKGICISAHRRPHVVTVQCVGNSQGA